MKLFIDTSIFVDALRTKQVESSKSLFTSLQEGSNKAFTAVITVAELSVGAYRSPRKDDLDGIERIALSFGLSIAISPIKRGRYISRDITFKKRGSKKDANSIGKDNESCGNY
ncbi:hypothetical protein C5S29_03190 [ANME-1 cluster archaeon GoMg3.2]|nr:hypothetical protein [ANME-1 cluster archaeon GoMg3.2]